MLISTVTTGRPIWVLEAPSNLGLRPPASGRQPGVCRLPEALLSAGLAERLGATRAVRVEPPPYTGAPDPTTGFLHGPALATYSGMLGAALEPLLTSGAFTLVLGGDCSVLLGVGRALQAGEPTGLVFIDGHDDYSPPRDPARATQGTLTAAGLDLALVTGRGPKALASVDGRGPAFLAEQVVHLGLAPEPDDARDYQVELFRDSGIGSWSAAQLREGGAAQGARQALAALTERRVERLWVHLDVDVLSASELPAVDSPNPAGLTFSELEALLTTVLADGRVRGLDLTIFDPDLDPDGRYARRLVDLLGRAFAGARG